MEANVKKRGRIHLLRSKDGQLYCKKDIKQWMLTTGWHRAATCHTCLIELINELFNDAKKLDVVLPPKEMTYKILMERSKQIKGESNG